MQPPAAPGGPARRTAWHSSFHSGHTMSLTKGHQAGMLGKYAGSWAVLGPLGSPWPEAEDSGSSLPWVVAPEPVALILSPVLRRPLNLPAAPISSQGQGCKAAPAGGSGRRWARC